jgi:predicted Zn-dependent protease
MILKQYEKAFEAYQQTHEIEGANAETYCCMGAALEKMESYDRAIKLYSRATKLDEEYDEAWFGVGSCFHRQSRWMEATHALRKAIRLNDENYLYWYTLAEAERELGNIASSGEAFEEASLLNPACLEIWQDWSYLYFEQADFDQAISVAMSGLEEFPDNPDLFYYVTAYLISAGQYKEAFNYLENALTLDFDKHEILYDFFPKLETQKALFKIIDQYRK